MFALTLVACALGAVMLVLGLRGRRRGDEPRCAACAFDLSGLLERDPDVCPECGAGLRPHGAVVRGERTRTTALVAAGVVLIVLGAAALVVPLASVNLAPWTPARPLAAWTRWTGSGAGLDELRARLEAGTLGRGGTAAAIDAALSVQADPDRAWDGRWGALVEVASLKGLLTSSQERRYLDQMFRFTGVRARSNTLPGWVVPVHVEYEVRRGGVRGVSVKTRLLADIRGFERPRSDRSSVTGGFGMGAATTPVGSQPFSFGHAGVPVPTTPVANQGEHTLDIDLTWWTFWEGAEPAMGGATPADLGPASGAHREARPIRVTTPASVVGPAAAELAVSSSALGVYNRADSGGLTQRVNREGRWERVAGADLANVVLIVHARCADAAPGDVAAFDVWVTPAGDARVWIGRVSLPLGVSVEVPVYGVLPIPPQTASVTVELTPSPEAVFVQAEGTRSVAGESLVIEGVKVTSGYPRGPGAGGERFDARPAGSGGQK
jgi:hypothetical protein